MATNDDGPTTLRNKAQMFLDVYYHVNGEKGDLVCSIETDGETDVTLPLGTHLQFVGQDSGQDFDIYTTVTTKEDEAAKYNVFPLKTPIDQLPVNWHSVSNFESVLHGYDLLYMDPLAIDSAQGQRKNIYESLSSTGRDYTIGDGNVYYKEGFNYCVTNSGWGQTKTQMQSSMEEYQKEVTSGFGVSIPVAGSLSLSFTNMTDTLKEDKSMYTISVQRAFTYYIDCILDEAKMEDGFVESVQKLPYDSSITLDTVYGDLSGDMQTQLTQFIADYGTHMSLKMKFGGTYILMTGMTEHDMKVMTQSGRNIEASATLKADGVPVSGNGNSGCEELSTEGYEFQASESMFYYRGGSGGVDSWGVDDVNDSQAFAAELQPISEILVPTSFPVNIVPSDELATKKQALSLAISNYIGSADTNSTVMSPVIFKIEFTKFRIDGADGYLKKIWGNISMTPSEALADTQKSGQGDDYYAWDHPDTDKQGAGMCYDVNADETGHPVMTFQPTLSDIGDGNFFITCNMELHTERNNGHVDGYCPYGGLIVPLYNPDKPWVSAGFEELQCSFNVYNYNSNNGFVKVYFTTSWEYAE